MSQLIEPLPDSTVNARDSALQAGIDLSLTYANLRLTPEQRIQQHQSALDLALTLERAGRNLRGESDGTPAAAVRR